MFEDFSTDRLNTSFQPLTAATTAPFRLNNQSQNRLRISQYKNLNPYASQDLRKIPSGDSDKGVLTVNPTRSLAPNLRSSVRPQSNTQFVAPGQNIDFVAASQDFRDVKMSRAIHDDMGTNNSILTYEYQPDEPIWADRLQEASYQDDSFVPETEDRYYLPNQREPPVRGDQYSMTTGPGMNDQPIISTDGEQDFTTRSQLFSDNRFLSPIQPNLSSLSPIQESGNDFIDFERSAKKRK